MTLYVQNPVLQYLTVSPDEASIQGSPLDGFSLWVTDDTARGLTAPLIAELEQPKSAADVHAALKDAHPVAHDEIEALLEELASSGAVLRCGHNRGAEADYVAFARTGVISLPQAAHPVVVAGGRAADRLVERLAQLGLSASRRGLDELTDLSPFTVVERAPDEDDAGATAPAEPRLVVLPDGTARGALYALNERAVAADAPVFYLHASGVQFSVGPHVVPGSTACHWELERQHARTRENYAAHAAHAANGGSPAAPAVTVDALLAAAVPFLVELSMLGRSSLAGRLVRGRATTAETTQHSVMRLPRCPVCLPKRPLIRNPLY